MVAIGRAANDAGERDIRQRLLAMPIDGRGPDLALDAWRSAFGAVVWAAHRMSRTRTGYAPEFIEQLGWSESGIGRLLTYVGDVGESPFLYDPERPDVDQRNRVRVLDATERERVPAHAWKVLTSAGVDRLHQIRVVVCDGPELVGWFGGFRERPFTRLEQARLARLVPAVRTALLWKRRLARAAEAHASFEAVIHALSCPASVVRAGRTLEHVNAAGRPLVETHGRGVVAFLVNGATAGLVERVTLTGHGSSGLELFLLRGPSRSTELAIARATETWRLTHRQRDVLTLIARGDTNKTIATKLACAEVTVELHVTALLRKAEVSNRTELVARLWSLA